MFYFPPSSSPSSVHTHRITDTTDRSMHSSVCKLGNSFSRFLDWKCRVLLRKYGGLLWKYRLFLAKTSSFLCMHTLDTQNHKFAVQIWCFYKISRRHTNVSPMHSSESAVHSQDLNHIIVPFTTHKRPIRPHKRDLLAHTKETY